MPSTASLILQATVEGFPFSTSTNGVGLLAATFTNSSAVNSQQTFVLPQSMAAAAGIAGSAAFTSCLFAMLFVDTTYKGNYRISVSTAETGILLHGRFPAVIGKTGGLQVYTTSGSSARITVWQV